MRVPVPKGSVATTVEEAGKAASAIGYPVAIKSQLLRGGRGKAGAIHFRKMRRHWPGKPVKLFSSEIGGEKIEKLLVEEKIIIDHNSTPGSPSTRKNSNLS